MKLRIVAIFLLLVFIYSLVNVETMVSDYNEETFSIGNKPLSVTIITNKNKQHYGTVLFIHGYSGHKETLKLLAYAAASTGLISVLIDLPGHGGSGGFMEARAINPRIAQFEDDILEIVEFLKGRGYNLSKLSVVGHSMGGALACYLGIKYDIFDVVVGIAPGIGHFVDIVPQNFSVSKPKNILLVLAESDMLISESTVIEAFKRTINQDPEFGNLYNVSGHYREIIKIPKTDHTNIIFSHETHSVVVSWIHKILFGKNITLQIDTQAIHNFSQLANASGLLAFILLIISAYGGRDENRILISKKTLLIAIGLSFL
ncbi:MAG: alpha/beta hydrolase, partial [Candidatus Njordarchaeota archaeon]